jgi:ABC-type transport system involved in multi-copper enzyme maturation permease subunit
MKAISVLTFKEAIRSRWLMMFTVVFFFLAFNVPVASLVILRLLPQHYLSTFIASVITVSFPIIPLLPLPLGSTSIVEEKESGFLQYILATRISRVRFILARFAGLFAATTSITALGFGAAALLAFQLTPEFETIWYVILASCILTASMLSISLVVSVLSKRWRSAIAVSIFIWLVFTVISDSVIIAQTLAEAQKVDWLLPFVFLNPVELSRLLALTGLGSFSVIDPGASGRIMNIFFGSSLPAVLGVALALWIEIPLVIAIVLFNRQDIK